jgi:hypothetical protein
MWDGLADGGAQVSSGVYYVRVAADGGEDAVKIVLLK